jgi:hypothetical protein
MIQTEQSIDRGTQLFQKFEGAITQLVLNRKKQWFDSPQYKGLQNNCKQMDLYVDNMSPAISTFISDITPQTIRRGYNEFSALFNKFFETDPLFSVRRNSKISEQQEHDIITALTDNLEKTYFRERCLFWDIDNIVRYGTAVNYSFATNDYNANSLMTIKGEDGYNSNDTQQVYNKGGNCIVSTPIHPLNVIMDSRANFMVSPDYMGFIGDISVANIAVLLDNKNYNTKNLNEVFEQCKQGLPDEHWYGGPTKDKKDYSRGHSNITYLWTRLPFEGNEDDPTWYAIEMIGAKIIRIEENVLDENTIPLSIMRILPRQYTWYGNSPLVDKICIQNMQYWLINMTVESTARLMDRIIFYRGGTIDKEALDQRHQTGGLVPYSGQMELEKLLYAPQFPATGFTEANNLMQLMRREDQDSSAMPNFNPQAEGGPSNKTLGGAQMMASIGEIKMANLVNQMAIGLKDTAKHQIVLMRNISGDSIKTTQGKPIPKASLLGPILFSTKISNVFNYIREGIDSQNRLTQLINYLATKRSEFSAIKVSTYIKDWIRNSLKRENINDYIDEAMLKTIEQNLMSAALQPPAQQKPAEPSQSISYKDLPPAGQVQMAAKAGIQINPIEAQSAAMPLIGAATGPAPNIPGANA